MNHDPVSLADVHHQGAGLPSDQPVTDEGYSVWINDAGYTLLLPPWLSFATLHENHVSADFCFAGDRMVHPVTPKDLQTLAAAAAHCKLIGWMVDVPVVRPHGTLYPPPPPYPTGTSPTQCPGTGTIAVWPGVVDAIDGTTPPPTPPVHLQGDPMLFPSNYQPTPNRFRGVRVDPVNKTTLIRGDAKVFPDLSVIPASAAAQWLGAYDLPDLAGHARFKIVLADDGGSEFAFTIDGPGK